MFLILALMSVYGKEKTTYLVNGKIDRSNKPTFLGKIISFDPQRLSKFLFDKFTTSLNTWLTIVMQQQPKKEEGDIRKLGGGRLQKNYEDFSNVGWRWCKQARKMFWFVLLRFVLISAYNSFLR